MDRHCAIWTYASDSGSKCTQVRVNVVHVGYDLDGGDITHTLPITRTDVRIQHEITRLNHLGKDIQETEDVVAHEVVVAVVVLVLSSQEKRLAELPRVHVGDGDGTRHHEEHSACQVDEHHSTPRVHSN